MQQKQARQFRLTDEQRTAIREQFPTTRTNELAERLGLNYFTLQRAAVSMGLKKADDFREAMSTIASDKAKRIYPGKTVLYKRGTDESKNRNEWMRQHWPTTPDEVCAAYFGVNPRTIRRWAFHLGLSKDCDASGLRRRIGRMASPEEFFDRVAYIAEHYPTEPAQQVAEALGVSKSYIWLYAKKFGIKKQTMEQKRDRKPVAQLDAETLEVIKIWPSRYDAEEELASSNIKTAIKLKRKAKGYYWCDADDAADFKPAPPKHRSTGKSAEKQPKVCKSLADYTSAQLMQELERRGWKGELTRQLNITIGK